MLAHELRLLPPSGDWQISSNCILENNATVPANITVKQNVTLILNPGISLNIDFQHYNLRIETGGRVRVKARGKVY